MMLSISLCHLSSFFGEVSIQILGHLKGTTRPWKVEKWCQQQPNKDNVNNQKILCHLKSQFLLLWTCKHALHILDTSSLSYIRYMICKYFSSILCVVFSLYVIVSFKEQGFLNLIKWNLCIFFPCCLCFWCHI